MSTLTTGMDQAREAVAVALDALKDGGHTEAARHIQRAMWAAESMQTEYGVWDRFVHGRLSILCSDILTDHFSHDTEMSHYAELLMEAQGPRECSHCGGEGEVTREPSQDGRFGDTETCNECDEGYTRTEVYEWWAVSEWFSRSLAEHDCVTCELDGLYIWGRETTGQAISGDCVVQEIAKEWFSE